MITKIQDSKEPQILQMPTPSSSLTLGGGEGSSMRGRDKGSFPNGGEQARGNASHLSMNKVFSEYNPPIPRIS
jgi:hypothetical protein